jgi:hypothetical protein
MKKRKAKKAGAKDVKPTTQIPIETGNDPLDFGGIPPRDLKKNLGCG